MKMIENQIMETEIGETLKSNILHDKTERWVNFQFSNRILLPVSCYLNPFYSDAIKNSCHIQPVYYFLDTLFTKYQTNTESEEPRSSTTETVDFENISQH